MRDTRRTYERRYSDEEMPYYGEEGREPWFRGERSRDREFSYRGEFPRETERGPGDVPRERERHGQEGFGRDEGFGRAQSFGREHGSGREERFGREHGPFFGRGPRGFRRSDDRIYDEVGDRLTRDPWIDASDIQLEVRDATVFLRGAVADREAKRRADDLAEGVSGVGDVRNELRVRDRFDESWRTSALPPADARSEPMMRGSDVYATVVGVFRELSEAERAIGELKSIGFTREDISFLTKDRGFRSENAGATGAETKGATAGAIIGGLGGGALGWLLGIGALAIPGLGPVVATGVLATTIAGAATGAIAGGLVGALVGVGVPENEAKEYEKRVKEGGILVTVTCRDEREKDRAKDLLRQFNAEKVDDFRGERREFASGRTGNGQRRESYTR